jgi:hypothetical protein
MIEFLQLAIFQQSRFAAVHSATHSAQPVSHKLSLQEGIHRRWLTAANELMSWLAPV